MVNWGIGSNIAPCIFCTEDTGRFLQMVEGTGMFRMRVSACEDCLLAFKSRLLRESLKNLLRQTEDEVVMASLVEEEPVALASL